MDLETFYFTFISLDLYDFMTESSDFLDPKTAQENMLVLDWLISGFDWGWLSLEEDNGSSWKDKR